MKIARKLVPVLISLLYLSTAVAANTEIWTDEAENNFQLQSSLIQNVQVQNTPPQRKSVKQFKHRYLRADIPQLKAVLSRAPLENVQLPPSFIDLPMPDGEMHTFVIEESPIMAPGLAEKFPEFKTYRVRSADNAAITGRLDFVSSGFHGYLNTDKGVVFINPEPGSTERYRSFYKNDVGRSGEDYFSCGVKAETQINIVLPVSQQQKMLARSSNELLTYRLAVAATREYSLAVTGGSGDNAATLTEIGVAINRVNFIYERDLAIRLELIGNNDLLISDDSSDFTNNDATLLIEQSGPFINARLADGSADYDIGHVFSTGAGGLASLGVVCDDAFKAEGVTGISKPVGDAFYIDYVAHEIGHQFSANHSFNGTTDDCGGGNRNPLTAFEPGSGTTIMAYASICGAENVQTSSESAGGASDDTFHAGSIDEIVNFTRFGSGNNCDLLITNTNSAPLANAGLDYNIPAQTPFELTGSATDDGPAGALTYQWDEMDAGRETNSFTYGTDLGNNALFRSFTPSSAPARTLPRIETILSGVDDKAETLPNSDRTLNFRLTVRDQNLGVDDDDMQVTVNNNAGPFQVLSAATAVELDVLQPQVLEWNAACSHVAPVSCTNVDILLSTDSGASFPTTILAATANDGEETVNFPAVSSTTALIKIACTDNIFFDVNDSLITLKQGSGSVLTSTGAGGTGEPCVISSSPGSSSGGIFSMNIWFLAALLLCGRLYRRSAGELV